MGPMGPMGPMGGWGEGPPMGHGRDEWGYNGPRPPFDDRGPPPNMRGPRGPPQRHDQRRDQPPHRDMHR
jgi:hypothetical protein